MPSYALIYITLGSMKSPLCVFVSKLRGGRRRPDDVPWFDPENGNEKAKFLLVLEAPGPMAIDSQKVSIENDDPTAKNLKSLLLKANILNAEIAVWNVVPWYVGNSERTQIAPPSAEDIAAGIDKLVEMLRCFSNLACIVLIGSSARKAHIQLSSKTNARILACHHTSQRVANATRGKSVADNEAVFNFMRSTSP